MRRIARSKRHQRRAQRRTAAQYRPAGRPSILGRRDAWVSRFIDDLSHTGFAKATAIVAAILSVGAVIGTFVALKFDIEDRDLAREERQTARLERAWNRLLRPAVGNTGKGLALNTLLEAGQSLDGVDLSCERMGGKMPPAEEQERPLRPVFFSAKPLCSDPPIIAGVHVDDTALLRNLKFIGADLRNWNIVSQNPLVAAFDGSVFRDSALVGTRLYASDKSRVTFEDTSLRGSSLADFQEAALSRTDLTGATFSSGMKVVLAQEGFLAVRHLNFMDVDKPVRCESTQSATPLLCDFIYTEPMAFCLKSRRSLVAHMSRVRERPDLAQYEFFPIPGVFLSFFRPKRPCTHLEGTVEEPLLILTYDEAVQLRPMIYLGRPLPHP